MELLKPLRNWLKPSAVLHQGPRSKGQRPATTLAWGASPRKDPVALQGLKARDFPPRATGIPYRLSLPNPIYLDQFPFYFLPSMSRGVPSAASPRRLRSPVRFHF